MSFLKKELAAAAALAIPLLLAGCGTSGNEAPENERVSSGPSVVFNKIADSVPKDDGIYVLTIPAEKIPELKRTEPLVCVYASETVYRGGGPAMDCNF